MARVLIDETIVADIANSIKAKTGSSDPIRMSEMSAKINSISTGGGGTTEEFAVTNAVKKECYSIGETIPANTLVAVGETISPLSVAADESLVSTSEYIIKYNTNNVFTAVKLDDEHIFMVVYSNANSQMFGCVVTVSPTAAPVIGAYYALDAASGQPLTAIKYADNKLVLICESSLVIHSIPITVNDDWSLTIGATATHMTLAATCIAMQIMPRGNGKYLAFYAAAKIVYAQFFTISDDGVVTFSEIVTEVYSNGGNVVQMDFCELTDGTIVIGYSYVSSSTAYIANSFLTIVDDTETITVISRKSTSNSGSAILSLYALNNNLYLQFDGSSTSLLHENIYSFDGSGRVAVEENIVVIEDITSTYIKGVQRSDDYIIIRAVSDPCPMYIVLRIDRLLNKAIYVSSTVLTSPTVYPADNKTSDDTFLLMNDDFLIDIRSTGTSTSNRQPVIIPLSFTPEEVKVREAKNSYEIYGMTASQVSSYSPGDVWAIR